MPLAGRHFGERLAKNAAALHNLQGADEQTRAHVAGGFDGHVEFKFGVGGVGRGAAKVLCYPGGSCGWTDHTAGDGSFMSQNTDAGTARARRCAGGEDGDHGANHFAFQLLDHSQHGTRIGDVAIDPSDAVH